MATDFDFTRIKANFTEIVYYKNLGKLLEDVMSILGFNQKDRKLFDLCTIAYNNSENEEKAIDLMQKYLDNRNIIKQSSSFRTTNTRENELINKIDIIVCCTTKLAWDKLIENAEENERLLKSLILKRTSFVTTNGNVKYYDVVPIEYLKDEFGSWKYDPLAGHMRLFAKLDQDKSFPKLWKLDSNSEISLIFPKKIPEDVKKEFNANMTIDDFLEQTFGDLEIKDVLSRLHIYTLEDLKKLDDSESGWKSIENSAPSACVTLRAAVKKLHGNSPEVKEQTRTPAEELHDWHKLILFLNYVSRPEEYKKLSFLDFDALEAGFREQQEDKTFDIGSTMTKIKDALSVFTVSGENTTMRENSHGMLLYGPPGTGKTKLSTIIIKKAGLAQIVEPLSSAELNRSLVGATEKLLMAIFNRASYCPHLLCCIAIDEVDALTPKRNDKSAGHKIDALSLLLSLIGGIKNVNNVFVIASTNRLNKIDDAFARRLQDKFYIGRLTNKQRIDLLSQITKNEKAGLPKHVTINFDDEHLKGLLAKLTTNFSGAALAALRARILVYFDLNKKNENIKTLENKKLIELAEKVASDFQIKLGRYSIPTLMQNTLKNDLTNLWTVVKRNVERLSGRILIDLKDSSALIGFEVQDGDELLEVSLQNEHQVRYVSELIPYILDFCVKFQVDSIQLIDSDALLTAGAFDENAINELFNESFEEFDKFDNGIVVFDVDTLVGINESMSDASTTPSKSYSVQNQRLWQNILHASKRSYFTTDGLSKRKWCVLISGSEYLIELFKKLAKFPLSAEEKRKKKEEEENNTKERKCKNCDTLYFESQNRIEACSYHDGAIVRYDNPSKPINKESLHSLARNKTQEEIEKMFKSYYYACCYKGFSEGRDSGCKRNFHSDANLYVYDARACYSSKLY